MSWRLDSRRRWILIGLAAVALLMQLLLEATRAPVRQRDYERKLAAAELATEAFAALREHRLLEAAALDVVNDPAGTGLVGPEFSQITNSRGVLTSKLTGLNPNWAAVIVDYCRQAGLERGDPVAVAVSGSFPGLNIAVYAALETLRLRPVVITSVGASMWGANVPEFTWLDMERILYENGVFDTRTVLATYGGGSDMGRGLSPEGRRLIREGAERNQIPFYEPQNVEQAIARRMAVYEETVRGRPFKLCINVGGGVASLGSSHNKVLLPSGLSFDLAMHNYPRKGTMILFAEKGVPVVHLLRADALARRHGLPVAPDFLPAPGEGEIFVRDSYRLPVALAVLVIYCGLLVMILAPEIRRGIFDRLSRPRNGTPAGKVIGAVALLVLSAAPVSAESVWVSCKNVRSAEDVCLEIDGTRFEYHGLRSDEAARFTIKGPRRIKIVTRCVLEPDDMDRARYTIVVGVDDRVVLRKTQAADPLAAAAPCRGSGRVTALRKVTLDLGPGSHDIAVTAETEGTRRVACRIFRQVQRQRERYVTFSPETYASVRNVQFSSGNESTYYLADATTPVGFTVTGETRLKVFARLDFDHRMKGSQSYALEVLCDGEVWRTLLFDSRIHSSAQYVERPDLMPGTRDTFTIPVPRGRHTYAIRCVRPDGCAVALLVRIPRSDLER